ncbi:MAG: NAD-dependent epimerase/dehydratase family protein [Acidobacteriota bacterium]
MVGGTGHIGSYLTPMLFEAGHRVTCVSRRQRRPYREHACWEAIRYLEMDRTAEEQAGTFGQKVAGIGAEVVIDLTCYTPASAEQLVEALRGRVGHLLHCGTIWVHGPSGVVPTTEATPRAAFGDYGLRKMAIEKWLLGQAREQGLPVTVLHPGHIVGPGWAPLNPQGNFNTAVFSALRRGEELRLPNFGMETVHHVHAEDVAQGFFRAVERRDAAVGESFHVVSPGAVTLRGYAEAMAAWFGQPARLAFLPWEEWKRGVTAKDAAATEDHIRHAPHCSIEKARQRIGYEPRHSSLQAVQEAVTWLMEYGEMV